MALYRQSIPVFVKYLKNLSALLEEGRKFADAKGMKYEEMLSFRLISDMRPLPYQVTSCANTAKFVLPRVFGLPDTNFDDNQTTFPELQTRIQTTIELLESVKSSAVEEIDPNEPAFMKTASMGTFKFETKQQYVSDFAVPNFHFHLTTAYCILRHLGVPLDAMNYLGRDTFVKAEEQ